MPLIPGVPHVLGEHSLIWLPKQQPRPQVILRYPFPLPNSRGTLRVGLLSWNYLEDRGGGQRCLCVPFTPRAVPKARGPLTSV